jgi:glycosyltransferase involved in cell wall biosynthesis
MKILFCTQNPWVRDLGGPKVFVETAEALTALGWHCDYVSLADLAESPRLTGARLYRAYAGALRDYVITHADRYDVIDFDHEYLPFRRTEFSGETLLVARSALLAHHEEVIDIPARSVGGNIRRIRARVARRMPLRTRVAYAQRTVEHADLVNVSNDADRRELMRRGVDRRKIVVLPYGLTRRRRCALGETSVEPPPRPVVGFLGTFDARKGGEDLPLICSLIAGKVADVRFALLGTRGLYTTTSEVLRFFPPRIRELVHVTPHFDPSELPRVLAQISVGIFPSYFEGFPFAVLELLAAAVPVVAYDAPGAPMMLPAKYLVPRGDYEAMAVRAAELLRSPGLVQARRWARGRAEDFSWERTGRATALIYEAALRDVRSGRPVDVVTQPVDGSLHAPVA